MSNPTCETCRWWVPVDKDRMAGSCNRYPPHKASESTLWKSWCGEHSLKPDDERKRWVNSTYFSEKVKRALILGLGSSGSLKVGSWCQLSRVPSWIILGTHGLGETALTEIRTYTAQEGYPPIDKP